MAQEVAQATKTEVIEIRPIRLGSHKGVELLSKTKTFVTQTVHWRVYPVGSRLYVLALVGREKGQLVAEGDEFFDSFSVPAAAEEGAESESE